MKTLELKFNADINAIAGQLKTTSDERIELRKQSHYLFTLIDSVFSELESNQEINKRWANKVEKLLNTKSDSPVKCELDVGTLSCTIDILYKSVREQVRLTGWQDVIFTTDKYHNLNDSMRDARVRQLGEVETRTKRKLVSDVKKVQKALQQLTDALGDFKSNYPELEYQLSASQLQHHSKTNGTVFFSDFLGR